MKRLAILILFGLYLFLPASGQSPELLSSLIKKEQLEMQVRYLASDELAGRNTGEDGQKLAAGYIAEWFRKLHLTGPVASTEPYYQKMDLYSRKCTVSVLCNEHDTLDNLTEYMMDNGEEEYEGSRDFEVVFVGFGLDRDYRNVDVRGKIAMYFNGFPTADSVKPLNYLVVTDDKYDRARRQGAVGAIKLFQEKDSAGFFIEAISGFGKERVRAANPFGTGADSTLPTAIGMLPQAGARLLGIPYDALLQDLKTMNQGNPVPHPYEKKVHLECRFVNRKIQSENMVGLLKGEKYPEEVIILMAHYDHIGKDHNGVYPGANDNASGTAAVLEIAQALTDLGRAGYRPDRSILFLLFTAEEKGMLGSKYYVENPVVPLNQIKALINLDMLGRSDRRHGEGDRYIYVDMSGPAGSPVHRACESIKSDYKLDSLNLIYAFKGNTNALGQSDHLSFSAYPIPFVYYYNGTHLDWHKPSDTPDRIDFIHLANITRHIAGLTWHLASGQK